MARRTIRWTGWCAVVALSFAFGAALSATVAGTDASSPPATISDGTPEAGRAEILRLLEDRYFSAVSAESLASVGVADLPTVLDDPYTHFLTSGQYERFMTDESADAVGIGLSLSEAATGLMVTRVFPGSPAAVAGLTVGDVVTAVDGRSVEGMKLSVALPLFRGSAGTIVNLTLSRNAVGLVASIMRRTLGDWMVFAELRPEGTHNVGYIALFDFSENAGSLVRHAVNLLISAGADRLVLDLRDNPGGWANEAVAVAGVFLPTKSPVLIESSVHEGTTTYSTHDEPVDGSIPLAVLVDGQSASSAEIVTGALRDNARATVVGATTYGKGRIQDVVPLATGGAFKLTIAEYLTPSGYALDRVGLRPDVSVAGTPVPGADSAYTAAVSLLTTGS